ncbi:MAG TPA: DEAD/DEAH box helicase, partial [Planctomycetes bacterium]|nr:DEAD/DEAH box helicase [Planctomycetota bacterium]
MLFSGMERKSEGKKRAREEPLAGEKQDKTKTFCRGLEREVPKEDLDLQKLRGVGPALAKKLRSAGYSDLEALVRRFPRGYRRIRLIRSLDEADLGRWVLVQGLVRKSWRRWLGGRRSVVTVELEAPRLVASFFNQAWLLGTLKPGRELALSGVLGRRGKQWILKNPRMGQEDLLEQGGEEGEVVVPLYGPGPEGISVERMRRLTLGALERLRPGLGEELDEGTLERFGMLPMDQAVPFLHCPGGSEELLERARRRIAFEEAREQMALVRARREERGAYPAPEIGIPALVEERIRARLPFELSEEQERCVREIRADLRKGRPMARLLQGEVGSGKTLVAVFASLAVLAAGYKVLFLAPTESLAEQHQRKVGEMLKGSSVAPRLLTGSTPREERERIAEALKGPAPLFVIGTHVLFSEQLFPHKLGLLVIDEQHRFGVEQRGRLFREAGGFLPHVLVMSATPIPRTLATAFYGDLDLSELRRPPVPRPPVRTVLVPEEKWPGVRKRIVEEARGGGRVFVVCPRIGADEGDEGGALATFEELKNLVPARLVHGRQKAEERRAAQRAFREGEVPCLVGTTVVEVGIDVPEATWMVVRGAERLGLSSLHQLRGRVG